jgi:hypothetical protein
VSFVVVCTPAAMANFLFSGEVANHIKTPSTLTYYEPWFLTKQNRIWRRTTWIWVHVQKILKKNTHVYILLTLTCAEFGIKNDYVWPTHKCKNGISYLQNQSL